MAHRQTKYHDGAFGVIDLPWSGAGGAAVAGGATILKNWNEGQSDAGRIRPISYTHSKVLLILESIA